MILLATIPTAAAPEPGREIELKHVVDPVRLRQFCMAIEGTCTPEVHDPARPVAFTRTTYLDTAAGDYFHSVAPRRRLRIREYASAASIEDEPLLTGACFLELKESFDGTRRKVRWRAAPETIRLVSRGALNDLLDPEIAERLREDRPLPIATTWYRRRAWTGPNGVRITVDDPPWLCRPLDPGPPGAPARPAEPFAVLPRPVVELKLAGPVPEWLARAVELLPPPRAVSKFQMAVSLALDGVARRLLG